MTPASHSTCSSSKDDYADEDIDRGHMVRREDPNWDPALPRQSRRNGHAARQQANFDTFHYTNAAVQHGDLNSSSTRWLGLEDYILKSARTHGFRASVLTGPVVRDDDDSIAPGVVAPREFWKVVVMEDADTHKLHATAYLLSQGDLIRDLLEKRSRVEGSRDSCSATYRLFQIAITDLAEPLATTSRHTLRPIPSGHLGGQERSTAANRSSCRSTPKARSFSSAQIRAIPKHSAPWARGRPSAQPVARRVPRQAPPRLRPRRPPRRPRPSAPDPASTAPRARRRLSRPGYNSCRPRLSPSDRSTPPPVGAHGLGLDL